MGIEAANDHLGLDVTAKAQLESDARSQGDLLPHIVGNMNCGTRVSNWRPEKYVYISEAESSPWHKYNHNGTFPLLRDDITWRLTYSHDQDDRASSSRLSQARARSRYIRPQRSE